MQFLLLAVLTSRAVFLHCEREAHLFSIAAREVVRLCRSYQSLYTRSPSASQSQAAACGFKTDAWTLWWYTPPACNASQRSSLTSVNAGVLSDEYAPFSAAFENVVPGIPAASKGSGTFVFVIHFWDPRTMEAAAFAGKGRQSIVVRIEPEDAVFTLSAMEPESATRTFAQALTQQTAFLTMSPISSKPASSYRIKTSHFCGY